MKRSVIQLAGKTYVISLPSKWVKQYNIHKGDELDISEDSNDATCLKISKIGLKTDFKKDVNLTNYGPDMTRRIIGALYKKGYDEVNIHYEEPETFNIIRNEIDSGLIGLEIINNSKSNCTLKMVVNQNLEDFDAMYRRLFYLLIGVGEDALKSLNPLNKEKLYEVILRDKNINKLADYCRRMINKSKDINAVYRYDIAENIEKIGDEYRDMFRFIYDNNLELKKNILKKIEDVNAYFVLFHKINYDFNVNESAEFSKRKKKLREEINELIKKASHNDIVILSYLDSIVKRIYDLNGVVLQMNF